MTLPATFTPVPRVCPRCFVAVPKHIHICPNCKVPQEGINLSAAVYNVLLALLALLLLVCTGWMLYQMIDLA
jgi:hypothetical protein